MEIQINETSLKNKNVINEISSSNYANDIKLNSDDLIWDFRKHKISIAPMLDVTSPHFRYLMRLITKETVLWTEMINHNTIMQSKKGHERELFFNEVEHPVVVQLGGSDPEALGAVSELCKKAGYDEINLNCGCPSSKVCSFNFGACLMSQPDLVYDCCKSIKMNSNLPVSVKCRLGLDKYNVNFFDNFVTTVSSIKKTNTFQDKNEEGYSVELESIPILNNEENKEFFCNKNSNSLNLNAKLLSNKEILMHSPSNKEILEKSEQFDKLFNNNTKVVDHLIIHARLALMGLDTVKNRKIPPLMYDEVYKLKERYPDLLLSINGGIKTKEEAQSILIDNSDKVIGVMIGRAAYDNPFLFSDFDSTFYKKNDQGLNREEIIYKYADYVEKITNQFDLNKHQLIHPLANIFNGERYNTSFKEMLFNHKEYKTENLHDHLKTVIHKFAKVNPKAVNKITIYDK